MSAGWRLLGKLLSRWLSSGGSERTDTGHKAHSEHPCQNGCGRMTWTGHTLCKICYKQVNFNNKPPSRSQMDSYNKVIATAGASGMSEGDFRASLINNASFAQDDVNALCASPTVRQMMGWA